MTTHRRQKCAILPFMLTRPFHHFTSVAPESIDEQLTLTTLIDICLSCPFAYLQGIRVYITWILGVRSRLPVLGVYRPPRSLSILCWIEASYDCPLKTVLGAACSIGVYE